MSLYPSLEDMKVGQLAQAQVSFNQGAQQAIAAAHASQDPVVHMSLYPSLGEWMGMDLSSTDMNQVAPFRPQTQALAVKDPGVVAPITGSNSGMLGLQRAEIKQGVREVIVCKAADGKVGLRLQDISKGIFVCFVGQNTPASMGGLRFGDQILQINGQTVAGFSKSKAMDLIKKSPPERVVFAVRDRPFERAVTLQKDSTGYVGFIFKNGKITAIGKDTSAARNGLLIDHALLEINGQNVIGLKDKQISDIFAASDRTVTVTIMPNFVFDHMVKCMSSGLVKKSMDHSIPEI